MKKVRKAYRRLLKTIRVNGDWKQYAGVASVFIISSLVLFWRLNGLQTSATSAEAAASQELVRLAWPWQDPTLWPVRLGSWVLHHSDVTAVSAVRAVNAALAVVAVTSAYWWLVRRYGRFVAGATTLSMMCSSLTLFASRYGGGYGLVLLVSWLGVVLIERFSDQKFSRRTWLGFWAWLALAVVTPMGWLMAVFVFGVGVSTPLARHQLRHQLYDHWLIALPAVVSLLLLAVASFGSFVDIGSFTGLSKAVLPTQEHIAQAGRLLLGIVGPNRGVAAAGSLNHLPHLDAWQTALLILGAFSILRDSPARLRLWLLSAVAMVVWFASSAGGERGMLFLAMIWPFIWFGIYEGLAELIIRWRTVFPRNPVAKYLGIALLLAVTLFSCSYQLKKYFVAWPQNVVTRSVYTSAR